MIYWSVFFAFLKIGLFGYGGGPAMIPLIEKEVVYSYGWMTQTEFVDALAMANTLPGPIATKMALLAGSRAAGSIGAVAALAGMLLPSTVLLVILMTLYYRYRTLPAVKGMVKAVRPVVIALLMVTVAHLSPRSVISWDTFIIALLAFVMVFYLKLHPILIILAAAVVGYLVYP